MTDRTIRTRGTKSRTPRIYRSSIKTRKPRSDSKLHGLAKEHRALVDKWLFDKGLTYQEVSEACLQMFGLKVSKSSVGRYYERESVSKRAPWHAKRTGGGVSEGVGKCVSEEADEEVSGWAREMCIGMLDGRGTSETEEAYQKTLAWMTKWALEEMQWPVADERDIKTVLRFMRILISARRERNEAMMVELARRKFEKKAARECIKYFRAEEAKGQSKVHPPSPELLRRTRGPKAKVGRLLVHGQGAEGLRRGEKDPMMMWDFPDGVIRRLPLLRQNPEQED